MTGLFKYPGFLGTGAPFISDLSLLLMLLTAVLFTIGWRLAVRKSLKAHRWVQTAAVVVNTTVVLIVMISSYVIFILPGIPHRLGEGSYGITTVHALLGGVSLTFGVYVVLVGYGLLPEKLRFTNFKLFMRASYVIYMLATFTGIMIYLIVFIFGI